MWKCDKYDKCGNGCSRLCKAVNCPIKKAAYTCRNQTSFNQISDIKRDCFEKGENPRKSV
jgi:hypothetical protein